jgi:hypothetical protein
LLRYELDAEIGPVLWSRGSEAPAQYRTPRGSVRHFCGICASPVCNHPLEPSALFLVVASLDDDSVATPWAHCNLESKAPWFVPRDDLPRFEGDPTREEWAALARSRRK